MEFYTAIKKKEQIIDRHNSVDEIQKHYLEQKQPDKTGYILYDATNLKFKDMKTNL